MKFSQRIARHIQGLRETAGLSQQELAVKGDLSLSLVAQLEQGKKADPRASTLLALAKALGLRPGDLLDPLVASAAPMSPAIAGTGKKKRKKKSS